MKHFFQRGSAILGLIFLGIIAAVFFSAAMIPPPQGESADFAARLGRASGTMAAVLWQPILSCISIFRASLLLGLLASAVILFGLSAIVAVSFGKKWGYALCFGSAFAATLTALSALLR
jgi:hypothetical protein